MADDKGPRKELSRSKSDWALDEEELEGEANALDLKVRKMQSKVMEVGPVWETMMTIWYWWRPVKVDPNWVGIRRTLGLYLDSAVSDAAIGIVVLFNIVVLIAETDATSAHSTSEGKIDPPVWCDVANKILLVLYLTELWLRIFVFRFEFFHGKMNVFDACIIIADMFSELSLTDVFENICILRLFRIVRLGRAVKILHLFPELALMMQGFAAAMRSIFWGITLVVCALTIWSIVAVQVLHPINLSIAEEGVYEGCARCPRAFATTWESLLTFMQHIVAGDSWGNVSLPIIEKRPITILFFMGVMSTVGMGVMNLILAVIVDASIDARKVTEQEKALAKEREHKMLAQRLHEICQELDTDDDHVLTATEIMAGYKENKEFRATMKVMDIGEKDMYTLFEIMDEDKSGELDYREFVDHVYKLKSEDSHTMQIFIKHYVKDILLKTRRFSWVQEDLTGMMKDMMGLLANLCSGGAGGARSREPDPRLEAKLDSENFNALLSQANGMLQKLDAPDARPGPSQPKEAADDRLAQLQKLQGAPVRLEALSTSSQPSAAGNQPSGAPATVASLMQARGQADLAAAQSAQAFADAAMCEVTADAAHEGFHDIAARQQRRRSSSGLPQHNLMENSRV